MEIKSSHKGQTVKTAVVAGTSIPDRALEFAMEHHGEHKGSLFGWSVREYPDEGTIEVQLFTD